MTDQPNPARDRAFSAIHGERLRQEQMWDDDANHTLGMWAVILGTRYGKLTGVMLDATIPRLCSDASAVSQHPAFVSSAEAAELRRRAVQVAAVAVALLEQLDDA